jgi:hypothetical protein
VFTFTEILKNYFENYLEKISYEKNKHFEYGVGCSVSRHEYRVYVLQQGQRTRAGQFS